MWYQIISYLKFRRRAVNKHGIHSPFVYGLVTKCFNDRSHHPEYDTLKRMRKDFLSLGEQIEVTDFGAGSRVFKSNRRKVSDIAKNAGITNKRQRMLFRLARYLKPGQCLELGTSLGLATSAIALASDKTHIITIEGCPNTAEIARKGFDRLALKNIDLRVETFDGFFQSEIKGAFDLVFIDGNHSKGATLDAFEKLQPMVHNDTVIIFDDIYWSEEMTSAWKEIIADSRVTVSIDSFQWGLIFFRKEQEKQHFTIIL